MTEEENPMFCPFCDQYFPDQDELQAHFDEHENSLNLTLFEAYLGKLVWMQAQVKVLEMDIDRMFSEDEIQQGLVSLNEKQTPEVLEAAIESIMTKRQEEVKLNE